jgi:hypothetical protein
MTIAEVLQKATEGGYHINGSDGMETSYIGANDEYSAWTRTDFTTRHFPSTETYRLAR